MWVETRDADPTSPQIRDIEIQRPDEEASAPKFSIEGEMRGMDSELIEQTSMCNGIEPVSLTSKMETTAIE